MHIVYQMLEFLPQNVKDGVDKVNETLGISVAVTKGINEITKLFTGEEDE